MQRRSALCCIACTGIASCWTRRLSLAVRIPQLRPCSAMHPTASAASDRSLSVTAQAHAIKQRSCSTAKAVLALQSEHKWCLSGTPLQNRVSELHSHT